MCVSCFAAPRLHSTSSLRLWSRGAQPFSKVALHSLDSFLDSTTVTFLISICDYRDRMLLEADADLNHVTSRGTCLHEAALYGKTDVVKLLLEVRKIRCCCSFLFRDFMSGFVSQIIIT